MQWNEQHRLDEARPSNRMQSASLWSSGPFQHYTMPYTQHSVHIRCTECCRPCSLPDTPPCNSIPGQSQGPHCQCTEEPFHHCIQPSAQQWYQVRCTECSRPLNYPDCLRCNSVAGQSWGPHLQCSEEPFHHRALQMDHHLGHRVRCTECHRQQSLPDTLPCNSVPGQSRGPHLQCTEEHPI